MGKEPGNNRLGDLLLLHFGLCAGPLSAPHLYNAQICILSQRTCGEEDCRAAGRWCIMMHLMGCSLQDPSKREKSESSWTEDIYYFLAWKKTTLVICFMCPLG